MNNVKIIPVITARERPTPTFVQFLLGLWYMFRQLERKERIHIGVAFLTVAIPIGLLAVWTISYVVETAGTLPRPVQAVASPVSLILPIPDPAPTIFPEEVPVNSEYASEEEDEFIVPKPVPKKKKNDAAPRGVREIVPASAHAYIARYAAYAKKCMRRYGVPASISLAQGMIESNSGKSKLAVNANNHFGMKCFSKNCSTGHCINATDDTHKDFFRKFKSAAESYDAHGVLISGGRYASLRKNGNNYKRWAYGLKSKGYATDKRYAEKLIGIIERYDLYKYDR